MSKVRCHRCGYGWETKSGMSFVTCPSCGYKTPRSTETPSVPRPEVRGITTREVIKVTSKTPWIATAATVMIVAALGAWALWSPVPQYATITATLAPGTVWTTPGTENSGIEAIYIIGTTYNEWENLDGDGALLGTISYSGQSVDIPYETAFHIVVSVVVHSDNMAYVTVENMNVGLGVDSGSFTQTLELKTLRK